MTQSVKSVVVPVKYETLAADIRAKSPIPLTDVQIKALVVYGSVAIIYFQREALKEDVQEIGYIGAQLRVLAEDIFEEAGVSQADYETVREIVDKRLADLLEAYMDANPPKSPDLTIN